MSDGEFSLFWWDADGGQHDELRFVDPKTAVEKAHALTISVGGRLSFVERVIITDGGDCTNFEWKKGAGSDLQMRRIALVTLCAALAWVALCVACAWVYA